MCPSIAKRGIAVHISRGHICAEVNESANDLRFTLGCCKVKGSHVCVFHRLVNVGLMSE